jgi:PleD family two-component response regulator
MSSVSGVDNHLGKNSPVRQSEQEEQQQQQKEKLSPYVKRILVVDDDPDITLTFKKGLEEENETSGNKESFQAFT